MKAVFFREHGGLEKLAWGDLPDPVPGPGQALLKVRACALNHLDLWVLGGLPAYKIGLPHVPGQDLAGEVLRAPEDSGLKPGDKVLAAPGVSCWSCPYCLSGRDNLCESYAILGADGGWGGLAELAVAPARNLLPLPAGMSFEEAAALPLTFLTAWHMLKTLAGAGPGATVLVAGASSGVGTAAIRVAKTLGCRVLAATTSEEKAAALRALGADEVLAGPPEGLARRVRRLTGGRGVEVVFEHVGPAVLGEALKSLAAGGTLVTCGATSGPTAEVDLRQVFFRELRLLGAKMGTQAELREVLRLAAEGRLKPAVDRVFPLAEARPAFERLAARRQTGKIVVVP